MVRRFVVAALVVFLSVVPAVRADAQTTPRRPAPKKPPVAAPAVAAPRPVATPPPVEPSGVKVVTAYTQGAQVSENTTYIRGGRQRVEFPGMVSIDQCDLKRAVLLSTASKRYRVQPYAPPEAQPGAVAPTPTAPDFAAMAAAMGMPVAAGQASPGFPGAGAGMGAPPARGGVVTVTTALADTLERQTMFGLEARRIKTVVTRQASSNACDKAPQRTEIDAWYVDLPKGTSSCGQQTPAPEPAAPAGEACQDRIETHVVGDVTLGFPVKTVTTNVNGEGDKQDSSTTTAEVTALEIGTLDAALFEVPADYVEAKSALELAPGMASGSSLADVLFGSTADGTSTAAPKRAGVVRIGVLEPVNKSGRTLQTRQLRQELVGKFSKAPYEALPLGGSSPQATVADSTKLECDYVLVTEVTEVKTSKSGKVGGFMKMASGGAPSKDHHEVKMAYRLYPVDGTATIKASGNVKADNGGGFGIGSALRVAAFAGQMYMGFASMGMMRGFGGFGGMGMGMSMMNPLFAMTSGGGMGSMGSAFYDPRSMAMSSMAMGFGGMGGMPGLSQLDPTDGEVFKVASEAAGDVANATTDQLKKSAK